VLGSVFSKTIKEQRKALLWWAFGLVSACLVTTAFYPSIHENAASFERLLESLPEGLRKAFGEDFASPAGYLQARLFSIFAPVLFLIFAIGAGSRAIAGEEEHKTLDLLLSTPVPRRRVLVDKALAMLAATVGLGLVLALAIVVSGPPFEIAVSTANVAAAVADCVLLAIAFGAIALAVGAGTGRRSVAIGLTAGLAAGSYLIDVLALSVDGLGWLQHLSAFFYYRAPDPIAQGLDPWDAAILATIAIVATGIAVVAFDRRDLAA
jgi:beta-exotoxin I transport system permease protein